MSQEAIKNQLHYEEVTRSKLTNLDQELANIVVAMEIAQGDALINQMQRLCHVILASLPLPLAKRYSHRLWGVIVHSVFKEWSTGKYNINYWECYDF